jgi:hypothetical protein
LFAGHIVEERLNLCREQKLFRRFFKTRHDETVRP